MQSTLVNKKGVSELIEKIRELRSQDSVKKMVNDRMKNFRSVHEMDSYKWYEELVYCLLTAFASAHMGQKCVDALCCENKLLVGSENEIRDCLVKTGHRFPNKRAEYIHNAQHLAPIIKDILKGFKNSLKAREWLVTNIKGFGWKEASHFMRNVGYFDLAIIDRHIINNLREHDIINIDPKKGLNKKRYLEIENILKLVADELNMLLGELDLYMWYRKTGKVLK
jgi:N-glycosylase/DNA lyase